MFTKLCANYQQLVETYAMCTIILVVFKIINFALKNVMLNNYNVCITNYYLSIVQNANRIGEKLTLMYSKHYLKSLFSFCLNKK